MVLMMNVISKIRKSSIACLLLLIFVVGPVSAAPPLPFDPTLDFSLPRDLINAQGPDSPTTVVTANLYQDTFISGRSRGENFGHEEVLLVGSQSSLGEVITLLDYTWTIPDNYIGVTEATLFFGVGDGSSNTMPIEIMWAPQFSQGSATWNNIIDNLRPGPDSGSLGEVGYWAAIDVTETIRQIFDERRVQLAIRSQQLGYNFYKVTLSREGEPDFAPQLLINLYVDDVPPEVWFEEVPEWAIQPGQKKDYVYVGGVDSPDETNPVQFGAQFRADDGEWENLGNFQDNPPRFLIRGFSGQTVEMRLLGTDPFGNASDWVYSDPIKMYKLDQIGQITDHRGSALAGVHPRIQPEPWWTNLQPEATTYTARLADIAGLRAKPELAGYGSWRNARIAPLESVTIPVPPIDNIMGEMAATDKVHYWVPDDPKDTIVLSPDYGHSDGSLLFEPEQEGRPPARYCVQEWFDLSGLNQPTLGIYIHNGRYDGDVWLVWKGLDGSTRQVGSLRYDPPGYVYPQDTLHYWEYGWADLTRVRTQMGRPCLEMKREWSWNASSTLYIDSVSIGSTRSDFGLVISPPAHLPPPGEPYPIDLIVTNHSPYPATGILHLTIDGEPESRSWLLPELAPDEIFTRSVLLVSPAEDDTLWMRATVGKPEIDDTPLRNTAQWEAFHNATLIYQPLVVDQ